MSDYVVGQGGSLPLAILATTAGGSPVDPDSLALTITDPDDVEQLALTDLVDFVRESIGRYHYTWAVPIDSDIGDWAARWDGVIAGADAIDVVLTIAVVEPGSIGVPPESFTDYLAGHPDLAAYPGDTPAWPVIVGEDLSGTTLHFMAKHRYRDALPLLEASTGDGIEIVDAGRGWAMVRPGVIPHVTELKWSLVLERLNDELRTINAGKITVWPSLSVAPESS